MSALVLRAKRLHADAVLPRYSHPGDAGMDLCAIEELELAPGDSAMVRTGLAIEVPRGTEAQVRPRSGLAAKQQVTVLNTPGTIDEGYRGEVCVILQNAGDEDFVIKRGERIAQLVVAPVSTVMWDEADGLDESERGEGGFGHTGQSS